MASVYGRKYPNAIYTHVLRKGRQEPRRHVRWVGPPDLRRPAHQFR
jgi:hypothetical protein